MHEGTCPLQRAATQLALADLLLETVVQQGRREFGMASDTYLDVEVLLRDAEKHIREWVGTPSCAREYYFELCVSEWPVVHLLDRVQAKLNSLFTLDERPGQSCDAVHGACPACPCARQGEWIKEARFVSRFHAAVNALLGPHAIPVRID